MLDPSFQPQSGSDVVAFTIGVIALMQGLIWYRDRDAASPWFTIAYVLGTAMAAANDRLPLGDGVPNTVYLTSIYAMRACWAMGLVRYLGVPPRQRGAVAAALLWPAVLVLAVLAAGQAVGRLPALVPLLYMDAGFAALCVMAARREPGAGLTALAFGSLVGTAALLLAHFRGVAPLLIRHHYLWPSTIAFGILLLVVGQMRKSQESLRAQAHAQRMTNFYAALSDCNQAILRIRQADALYAEICRIGVETGHALLACVYIRDGDLARRAASAGPAERVLAKVPDPLDLRGEGARASLTAQALHTGQRVLSNDYQAEPRAAPWREQAMAHGVRAMAWLPLRRGGEVCGVLMLAADEVGFFDVPMVRLLDEMTDDISFALDTIDREAERVEYERQVLAGLERFSRLFHAAPVAAAIVSIPERCVVDVNAAMCARYELPREALIGKTTSSLDYRLVAEDRERFYEQLERDGHVRNFVTRAVDARHMPHLELLNAETIDHLGARCHLVMSLDITDLRAVEEARAAETAARSASRAKTAFLSRMSHELRTPLNAVLGFTALLESESPGQLAPRQLAQLDHVRRAGWHLLTLIGDVLDLSRIEAGQFAVEARSLALQTVLDEAVQMALPQARAAAVTVTLHAEPHDEPAIAVCADATRLRQVMLNLLSNAIKYNRAGGSVHIRVAAAESRVTIEVADTGIGMTADQLGHLFEPFNRLGRESSGVEGAGVGLALTRELLHLMHGEIEIDSEPGRGTQVRVNLPRAQVAPAPVASVALPETPAAAPQGVVLYIEDNAVNTLLVEQLLSRWRGVRFVSAQDGTSGLSLAGTVRPDLILLDMQLPDMNGLQVLLHLRSDKMLRRLPVVVLSASAMPEDIRQARLAGATDYWTKPLDFQRFLADVARLLAPASALSGPG
ncbi:hypothetical protein BH11PSE9_BH11PSE9_27760 [soil metagenome]